MIRGIYASASSLLALLQRQEAFSQNLANVNTPGFKQEIVSLDDGLETTLALEQGDQSSYIGSSTYGVTSAPTGIDYGQGPLQNTGRPLDLAVVGDGFFRVQTPDGERLTRDGTFTRDSDGRLVTAQGYFLLGENGPIQIDDGNPYVGEDGSIYLPGANAPSARIALGRVADLTQLQPEHDNLLAPVNTQIEQVPANQTSMRQGYLEQANVDVAGTMMGMMMTLRSYEATQRTLQMQDEALQQGLEIGRVA